MFVILYRIADTTTATRTGGTVSPMPVIENSNHEEEIIPVFVLFVLVLALFSSLFLVSSSFSLSFSLCFCFCPYPLCSFKTINIKDKCKDTKTRISYRTDTLLMIIALIHTMYESELRFASFENKR